MLQLVSRHVIKIQKIGFSYEALESGWPSSGSSWQCYYMLGIITKLSMQFQKYSSEININKVQKQDLKNIKNVKGCRDGMQKKYANKVGMI